MSKNYILLETLGDFMGAFNEVEEYNIIIGKKDLRNRRIEINNAIGESLKMMPVYLRDDSLVNDIYVGNAELSKNSFIHENTSLDEYVWKPRRKLTDHLDAICGPDKNMLDVFINESSRINNIYQTGSDIFEKFFEYKKMQNNLNEFFELSDLYESDVKKNSDGEILIIKENISNKLYISLDNKFKTVVDVSKSVNRVNVLKEMNSLSKVDIYSKTITRDVMVGLLESLENVNVSETNIAVNNKSIINVLYENSVVDSMSDNITELLEVSGWVNSELNANMFNIIFESNDLKVKDFDESMLEFNFIKDGFIKLNVLRG